MYKFDHQCHIWVAIEHRNADAWNLHLHVSWLCKFVKKNQLSFAPQTIENRCERLLYQTRFKTQISQTITALKPWPTFGLGDKLCWSAVNINHNNWIWQPHVPKTGIAIVLLYMISTFILLRLQTLCSKKGNKIESKMTIRTATEIILKILAMKLSRVLWSSILSVYHLKTLNLAHIHLYSHSGCSIGFKNWNGQTRAYVFFDQTIDMCVGKSKPCLNTIIHAFPMLVCTDFIDMNTSKVSAMWVGLRAQFALPWRSEFLNHAGTCHLTKQMFSQWPQDMQPPDPSADQTGQDPSSRIFVDPQMKNASRQDQSGWVPQVHPSIAVIVPSNPAKWFWLLSSRRHLSVSACHEPKVSFLPETSSVSGTILSADFNSNTLPSLCTSRATGVTVETSLIWLYVNPNTSASILKNGCRRQHGSSESQQTWAYTTQPINVFFMAHLASHLRFIFRGTKLWCVASTALRKRSRAGKHNHYFCGSAFQKLSQLMAFHHPSQQIWGKLDHFTKDRGETYEKHVENATLVSHFGVKQKELCEEIHGET